MKKKIVLIAGKIESGKDTVADHLVEELGFVKVSFADALKKAAAEVFEYPVSWGYTREGKAKKLPLAGGKTVGRVLQLFGTEIGRSIDPNVWVRKLISRIYDKMSNDRFVVPDCRFENEAAVTLHENPYSILLYLQRDVTAQRSLEGRDASHASEDMSWVEEVAKSFPDRVIYIPNDRLDLQATLAYARDVVKAQWA